MVVSVFLQDVKNLLAPPEVEQLCRNVWSLCFTICYNCKQERGQGRAGDKFVFDDDAEILIILCVPNTALGLGITPPCTATTGKFNKYENIYKNIHMISVYYNYLKNVKTVSKLRPTQNLLQFRYSGFEEWMMIYFYHSCPHYLLMLRTLSLV